eukprot:gene854-929_t
MNVKTKIIQTQLKGRCLCADTFIKAGTILLEEKPFVCIPYYDSSLSGLSTQYGPYRLSPLEENLLETSRRNGGGNCYSALLAARLLASIHSSSLSSQKNTTIRHPNNATQTMTSVSATATLQEEDRIIGFYKSLAHLHHHNHHNHNHHLYHHNHHNHDLYHDILDNDIEEDKGEKKKEKEKKEKSSKREEEIKASAEIVYRLLTYSHPYLITSNTIQLIDCEEALEKLSCNCFVIIDDQQSNECGIGLYTRASSINHSCDPNCIQMFRPNGMIVIRAIRDILINEEITISYIDLSHPRWKRQTELVSYGFQCSCHRCQSGIDDVEGGGGGGYNCPSCFSSSNGSQQKQTVKYNSVLTITHQQAIHHQQYKDWLAGGNAKVNEGRKSNKKMKKAMSQSIERALNDLCPPCLELLLSDDNYVFTCNQCHYSTTSSHLLNTILKIVEKINQLNNSSNSNNNNNKGSMNPEELIQLIQLSMTTFSIGQFALQYVLNLTLNEWTKQQSMIDLIKMKHLHPSNILPIWIKAWQSYLQSLSQSHHLRWCHHPLIITSFLDFTTQLIQLADSSPTTISQWTALRPGSSFWRNLIRQGKSMVQSVEMLYPLSHELLAHYSYLITELQYLTRG